MAANARALLHCVAVASDAAASPELWPSSDGRDRRGRKSKEGTMHILMTNEMPHLTREEFCGLEAQAESALRESLEASAERARAMTNLINIRRVLAWRDAAPG